VRDRQRFAMASATWCGAMTLTAPAKERTGRIESDNDGQANVETEGE
jgi:hypothetical protein